MPGGMNNLGEVFIPVNSNGNHWNFIHVRMQTKMIELWDSMGLQMSNVTYLTAAERFVKDTTTREEPAGRIAADQRRHVGWEARTCPGTRHGKAMGTIAGSSC